MRARRARACSPTSGSTSTPPRSSARTRSPCSSWSRSRGRSRPTCGCSCSTSRPRASTSTRCAELFRVIRDLKQRGVAILFVSHFLDQVYEICDRVTVLRDGKLVGEYLTRELLRIDLVQKMLGPERRLAADALAAARRRRTRASPFLSARGGDASGPASTSADVDLAEGEVLGVAGLLGSGRTELARALTGIDRLDAGIIRIQRQRRRARAARGRRSRSASSTRRRTAAPRASSASSACSENITLALQAERGILRRIRPSRQRELALELDRGARHPAARPRPPGRHAVGRQPAEGAARAAAGALAPRARARRADPRHRRRREGRDPEPRRRARRQRAVGGVHLGRARGGAAGRQPRRDPAGRPDRRHPAVRRADRRLAHWPWWPARTTLDERAPA